MLIDKITYKFLNSISKLLGKIKLRHFIINLLLSFLDLLKKT